MPVGEAMKRRSQIRDQLFVDLYVRFHMQGFDLETPLRSMRFGIQPTDEPAAV
jgi:hypothetical protein